MLVLNAIILIASFALMEIVAWATHKYVMHGWLWTLHRDHHRKEDYGFLERNDAFFLIFAIPGMLLIFLGYAANGWMNPRLWAGLGITLYGFTYLLLHDIFVHQRFKFLKRTENVYLMALRKAHKIHHKHLGKEDGECFGLLWVPRKYLREAKETKLKRQNAHLSAG